MNGLQWDIFCKVIDNFGDIGVCWRLCKDLAARGHKVRLWVDDSSALAWMAPDGCAGVEVMSWTQPLNVAVLATMTTDVLVEAFGCEVAPEFIAAYSRIYWAKSQNDTKNDNARPVWINLEYLTAESQAERNHALPSPVHSGPAAGCSKWFFYPGFTPKTGGLLREPDLAERQAAFDRKSWLASQGLDWHGEALVSLFCYEPPALAAVIEQLGSEGLDGKPARLLVAAGRAACAVKAAIESKNTRNTNKKDSEPNEYGFSMLSISYLPQLSQTDFDHLLWASDLNFVRGEDSLVRALWAGKPFVWQIYPQDDGAHHAKLDAFLDWLQVPDDLRQFHLVWSSLSAQDLPSINRLEWSPAALKARQRLFSQDDLTARLLEFVSSRP